jgi:hypothetical protein
VENADGRGGWGALAGGSWGFALTVPGATLLNPDTSSTLSEDEQGEMVWTEERVYRTPEGLLLFVQLNRRGGSPGESPREEAIVLSAGSPDELVAVVRRDLGPSPGRVEVLGRAGIEIGLEPGELDDFEDPDYLPPEARE